MIDQLRRKFSLYPETLGDITITYHEYLNKYIWLSDMFVNQMVKICLIAEWSVN